jgi:hypothetical protein
LSLRPGWLSSKTMNRTERLTERAITFAIAEADEDLAVARLAFVAQGDHAALDTAIDACLARTECTLYTRWRAISFLVRVRYEDPSFAPARTDGVPIQADHLPWPCHTITFLSILDGMGTVTCLVRSRRDPKGT